MQYVILDLEWNTAYSKRDHQFVNEIIEFGAVKLDENFEWTSSFSEFVQPQIASRLNSHVKKLTHITAQDLADSEPYQKVYRAFGAWATDGGQDHPVFLSWGDMDIRTLISNNQYFFKRPEIGYMEEYVDLQAYFMKEMGLPKSKQIGLSDAAELIHEDPDQFIHHRALDDSKLAAVCLKAVYDEDRFENAIVDCDDEMYKRILFKPYFLNDLQDKQLDSNMLKCRCMHCGAEAEPVSDWNFNNNSFHGMFECPHCNVKYRVNVSFKRTYNQIVTKKNVIELKPQHNKRSRKAQRDRRRQD